MKNFFIFLLILSIPFVSCQEDVTIDTPEINSAPDGLNITTINNSTLLSKLNNSYSLINKTKSTNSIIYDFSTAQKTIKDDGSLNILIVKGYSAEDNHDYYLGFEENENTYNPTSVIRRICLSENLYRIDYFTPSMKLYLSVKVNVVTKLSTIEFIDEVLIETGKTKASGQDVMDCITGFYSEEGWLSVALWVGTAFYPPVALSVAGSCVVTENLL